MAFFIFYFANKKTAWSAVWTLSLFVVALRAYLTGVDQVVEHNIAAFVAYQSASLATVFVIYYG
jgi:hypothetical protein